MRAQLGVSQASGAPVATVVRSASFPMQTPANRPWGVDRKAARRA